MDHEVLDFPIMIAKLEGMNLNQENPKEDPEKEEPQQESEKVLIQMKETLNDHRNVTIIRDFQRKIMH
jgi:translation initiation factor 1 (eIF-1/SUI1)